ncbi:unnamed protein product [Acanthosepion pharaonis]|uniref:Uncharacterized protein n=1 Tax=Acanthosepion pharaonis TaxID=158019 RepID=A0A812BBP4_ACAPH|nr:unnamed protein product [Sepia pharaonis]
MPIDSSVLDELPTLPGLPELDSVLDCTLITFRCLMLTHSSTSAASYPTNLASASFGRLHLQVFSNSNLRFTTKAAVYRAVVVSTLLYGCECWTLYRRQIKLLETYCALHGSSTCAGRRHQDHHTTAPFALGWACCADVGQSPPKNCILRRGSRPEAAHVGAQRNGFGTNLSVFLLEKLAGERVCWRSLCVTRMAHFQEERREALEGRRHQRRQQPVDSTPGIVSLTPVPESLSFADQTAVSFGSPQKTDEDGTTASSSAMTGSLR